MKKYLLYLLVLMLLFGVLSISINKPVNSFLPSAGPSLNSNANRDMGTGLALDNTGKSSEKQFIIRTFNWQNKKKEKRQTTLKIPKKALKEEIKNFGIVKNMYHPRYLKKQGFKRLGEEFVVDYKEVYQRNSKYFEELTGDLTKSAMIEKDRDPLLDLLVFTQQIEYKIPPKILNGKYIHEFYTPLQCLEKKTGDCDSKSVLLAEFLGTMEKTQRTKPADDEVTLAILVLKGYGIFHAILAIKRKPLPGTLKLFFHGKGYFMPLEASGPGWMPGFVGKNTFNCLKAGLFRFEALN